MPTTTNYNEQVIDALETIVSNSGASLPTRDRTTEVTSYSLDLLNSLGTAIATGLAVREVSVNCLTATQCIDQSFFIANRAYQVTAIRYTHATAGNDASAVNVQVTKDTGTNAPGAGTDLLTNNTNAGFNCKGTANTVQAGTLTATAASLQLAAGDRLSLDFAGTVTSLAGVTVTVTLKAI